MDCREMRGNENTNGDTYQRRFETDAVYPAINKGYDDEAAYKRLV